MDPLVIPPNIVVDDIGDITLEPSVGSHMIISTSAPQVADPSPSSPKAVRVENSTEGDLDFDHTPISCYLWHPKPPIPKVLMGSKLIIMTASIIVFCHLLKICPHVELFEGRGLLFKQ